ncbi:SDR family oxidoreductase [Mycobacterium sp. M23085]|uniref:SDR family oxidoreductase n=1 Tax=Mycobacterium sp. M23085 TaxID=3378087 RepID=UPI00387842F2
MASSTRGDRTLSGKVIVITGASSGFGRGFAEKLARAGHRVYASMRDVEGRNAAQADRYAELSKAEGVDIRVIDMDVQSQPSVDAAVHAVLSDGGRIDVLVHNAGHMVYGPAEAFIPEQFAALYDVNVIGTQRVNRAALPQMRSQQEALMVWISSSSCAGGTPPYLGPYFAAKAAMDSLAVSYARELARWGIETSIIVPGAFTSGTNHFANAGTPDDRAVVDEYEAGPYAGFGALVRTAFDGIVPPDADPSAVSDAVRDVVDTPFGQRPFRVYVDPTNDGSEVGFAVLDRLRAEMLYRVGLSDLLTPVHPG